MEMCDGQHFMFRRRNLTLAADPSRLLPSRELDVASSEASVMIRKTITGACLAVVAGAAIAGPVSAGAAASGAGLYRALPSPTRLATVDVAGRGTTTITVLGVAGVPTSDVSAVALTVSVGRTSVGGYVTVFADGSKRPGTSNINFSAGRAQTDQVYTPAGSDGKVAIFNGASRSARLYVDVTGYFAAESGQVAGAFVPTTPSRTLDTRSVGKVAARGTKKVSVLGSGGVPSSGVSAVVMTLTALHSSRGGYLIAYASGTTRPGTSNVNFVAGQAVGNQVVAQLGADGKFNVYNGSDGPVDLVGDVQGYFVAGPAQAAGAYVPQPPTRIGVSTVAARSSVLVNTRANAYPPGAANGMSLIDVSVSRAGAVGSAVTYGTNPRPGTASVQFAPGRASAALTAAPQYSPQLGNYERIFNGSSRSARFYRDYFGYFLAADSSGGTVTDATSGRGVGGVVVDEYYYFDNGDIRDLTGGVQAVTGPDGTYSVPIVAGEDYYLCFDARNATRPTGVSGYTSRCYHDQPYAQPGQVSAGTPISGQQVADQTLPRT